MNNTINYLKNKANLSLILAVVLIIGGLYLFINADSIVSNNQIELLKKVENISK